MKNQKIIIRINENEKKYIEEYINNLPWHPSLGKWNMTKFIMKLIYDEIYYNKKLLK